MHLSLMNESPVTWGIEAAVFIIHTQDCLTHTQSHRIVFSYKCCARQKVSVPEFFLITCDPNVAFIDVKLFSALKSL